MLHKSDSMPLLINDKSTSSMTSTSSGGGPSSSNKSSFFLKIPDVDKESSNQHWSRHEKYTWFFTLLFGTTAVYACRTTMPLVAPACEKSLEWSKTEVGTVLSSFFWGYALTQILGGYLSDRFGAERVLLTAGLIWGLLTFWFPTVVSSPKQD
jgi:sugar phosphate permease